MVREQGSNAMSKNGDKVNNNGTVDTSRGIWQDDRFKHLVADPRFKTLPKVERKVKIDKRFQQMFTNDRFKVKYTVDKYGRRVNKSTEDDLRKYYELQSSDDESDKCKSSPVAAGVKSVEHSDERSDEEERDKIYELEERLKEEKAILETSDKIHDPPEVYSSFRDKLLDPNIDYARGEGRLLTDSSDDESSEGSDADETVDIDHVWGELDQDAERTNDSTKRLAACNMNWDRIRAVDLMVLFSSFLQHGGSILSVKIYPSEFGKQRMKEEEIQGPQELIQNKKTASNKKTQESDEDSDNEEFDVEEQDSDVEEGDAYHMEKLRQYQLKRLRYYYAVIVCDKVATADKIYSECDGLEYESSATRIDLRFIPDEEEFEESEVVDVCTELPDISQYKPRQFTTTALQQIKVDLTWDETAIERKELGEKLSAGKLDSVSDRDLRKIVSYSSEDDTDSQVDNDEEEEQKDDMLLKADNVLEEKIVHKSNKSKKDESIMKYKTLLKEINEQEQKEKDQKRYEMEFTWDADAESKQQPEIASKENDNVKLEMKVEMTPIEKVIQKRLEKNRKRKEERKKKKEMTLGNDNELDYSSDDDDVDMNDPYFAEEFANGDFISPANKRMEQKEKQQQQKKEEELEQMQKAKELNLLLDDGDNKQHFSLEKILKSEQGLSKTKMKKLKKRQQLTEISATDKTVVDDFKMNVHDERFKAVYSSFAYNIDPSDSHFKKTKGMQELIQEKLKRRNEADIEHDVNDLNLTKFEAKKPRKQIEQTLLVKSLKNKLAPLPPS